jgi:predicted lysophospholipase L1 biosynthesis ABC-type transport system permease subunit
MTRCPAFSLALFLLVVLIVITLAGIGLVQEPPPESSGPDAFFIV